MKFLMIDDHPLVRQGLRLALQEKFAGCAVVEAGSAAEAMALAPRERWDVILTDLGLPDRGGLDLLKDLRNLAPDSPVLVLSGMPELEVGERALRAGAAGFLPKHSPSTEVVAAIRRLMTGAKYISAELAGAIAEHASRPTDRPLHAALSEREREVLRMLGGGITLSEIAHRLRISVKTAGTYRARLLEKLGLETTGELVRYAVVHGLTE